MPIYKVSYSLQKEDNLPHFQLEGVYSLTLVYFHQNYLLLPEKSLRLHLKSYVLLLTDEIVLMVEYLHEYLLLARREEEGFHTV